MKALFKKIIDIYNVYKKKSEMNQIKKQIHEMTYHIGRAAIDVSPEFIESLNISLDTFKKEDNDILMKFDMYNEMLVDSEIKLSAHKRTTDDIKKSNKDKIKSLRKEIKITKEALKNSTVKLKIRINKDKNNKARYRELTILKNSWDLNKTVKNLQNMTISNQEKLDKLKYELTQLEMQHKTFIKNSREEEENIRQLVKNNTAKIKDIESEKVALNQNLKKLHYKIGLKVLENNDKFPSLEKQFVKIGQLYQMVEDIEIEILNN